MPYYLETDDRELVKKLLHTNRCKECGGELEAFYNPVKGLPYLQCITNPDHEGIIREHREPRELNILTRREEMGKEYGEETTTALEQRRLPTSGALTESQALHILKLVYPDVPNDEIVRCAILCRDFGLHPLMKQVYIIKFGKQWVTVLGINATRQITANKGSFSYVDNTPRVMSKEEQETIMGEVDESKIWAITKLKTKTGLEAQGYGNYPRNENPYGTDKGNTRANMAFIRSERQAFSRLFPDALPQGVDVIDEVYLDMPSKVMVRINTTTGEITKQITDAESPPVAPESVSSPAEGEKSDIIPPEGKLEGEPASIDIDWLKENQSKAKFLDKTAISWLKSKANYQGLDFSGSLADIVSRMNKEQKDFLFKEIRDRVSMV